MDYDGQLVERVRAGSEEASAELLRRHQAQVRAYLTRFVRDREMVRDLAQETFLAAYRHLDSWRGEAPLRLWLLSIARNQALMHLREEARRRARQAASLEAAAAAWISERVGKDDSGPGRHEGELAALQECLKVLAPASAGIVQQYYFGRQSAADIARETGKRESAVWMALSRIRQALRQCIESRVAVLRADP